MDASVKLKDFPAPGRLMQPVDILGYDPGHLSFFFPFSQFQMSPVGCCLQGKHLVPVKPEKVFRFSHKKGVGEHLLRRIIVFLIVQAVHAAEVRNPALGGNARASEKNDIFSLVHPLLQKIVFHAFPPFFQVSGCCSGRRPDSGACSGCGSVSGTAPVCGI